MRDLLISVDDESIAEQDTMETLKHVQTEFLSLAGIKCGSTDISLWGQSCAEWIREELNQHGLTVSRKAIAGSILSGMEGGSVKTGDIHVGDKLIPLEGNDAKILADAAARIKKMNINLLKEHPEEMRELANRPLFSGLSNVDVTFGKIHKGTVVEEKERKYGKRKTEKKPAPEASALLTSGMFGEKKKGTAKEGSVPMGESPFSLKRQDTQYRVKVDYLILDGMDDAVIDGVLAFVKSLANNHAGSTDKKMGANSTTLTFGTRTDAKNFLNELNNLLLLLSGAECRQTGGHVKK